MGEIPMPDKDPSLMARCLECDSRIYFERKPDLGQIIVCPECETSLEVVRASPIRFDWADEGSQRSDAGSLDLDEFFNNLEGEESEEEEGEYDYDDEDGRY
jgi:lysine biosynthesis protein LysW